MKPPREWPYTLIIAALLAVAAVSTFRDSRPAPAPPPVIVQVPTPHDVTTPAAAPTPHASADAADVAKALYDIADRVEVLQNMPHERIVRLIRDQADRLPPPTR